MEFLLQREATMDVNKVVVMAVAGVVAATNLATNALHLVVGAMLVAPGFEPLLKVALGAVAGSPVWRDGLSDTAKGYGALALAAAGTQLLLPVLGVSTPSTSDGYVGAGALIEYWSRLTPTATLVAAVAGVGGALLVAATRSVLTAGIMVALALVPGATLAAMGLADGNLELAAEGAWRWVHDVAIVVAVGVVVLAGKRRRRRRPRGSHR